MNKNCILILFLWGCSDYLTQDEASYNSLLLNGDAWIEIENRMDEDTDISVMDGSFTLEFWFTGGNSGSEDAAALVSIVDDEGNIKFGIFKNPLSPNTLDFWLDDELLNPITLTVDPDLSDDGTFHHLAITSETDINIYIDGKVIKTINGSTIQLNDSNLIIGGKVNKEHSVTENFWVGHIDEMRLWSTVLDASQIIFHNTDKDKLAENYEDPHVAALTGIWRFQFTSDSGAVISDETCAILSQIYTSPEATCLTVNDAVIYTVNSGTATFSEEQP